MNKLAIFAFGVVTGIAANNKEVREKTIQAGRWVVDKVKDAFSSSDETPSEN